MSLIRGNRRSVSKHNSLIEPIEESKGEQDVFRTAGGDYIEPVPEEETFNQAPGDSDDSGSISLDDLGGVKQSPATANDSDDDEEFFEQSRQRRQGAGGSPAARRTSEPSDRAQLWQDEMDQLGQHTFDVIEDKEVRRTQQLHSRDLFAPSADAAVNEPDDPINEETSKKTKGRKREKLQ